MSEVFDARGVRIDYTVDGSGPPALVLHGAYSTRDEVLPVFGPILAEHGMRGVYPDLPGMGESTESTADTSDDVLDALDALVAAEVGDAPFAVIGHSFGAYLARGVAARHAGQGAGSLSSHRSSTTSNPRPRASSRTTGDSISLTRKCWAITSATSSCAPPRHATDSSGASGRR